LEVSFLKEGAASDPVSDDSWVAVPCPGERHRRLRVVPLPPGVRTRALRLSGPGRLDSSGRFRASLALATALAGRYVNIAPAAAVKVSSCVQPKSGFRPDPRASNPRTLTDGLVRHRNWSSAKREKPIEEGRPEWIVMDWRETQTMRGCALMIGAHESGAGRIVVQRFIGAGEPGDEDGWETAAEVRPSRPWRPPLCWEAACDFGRDVSTRALRFLMPAGLPKSQAAGGEGASPNAVSFGEIVVFQDLGDGPAPRISRHKALPDGVVPVRFNMPQKGKAAIRIVDEAGQVVKNLVSGQGFDAGEQTVRWDLSTIDDFWPPFASYKHGYKQSLEARAVALPGKYRWEGIWHPGLSLEYLYSYFPLKKHGLAWITADTTGGWLADHLPPQTVARLGDRMWVGTFCEAGHALLEADLDMRKLWGSGRIWLACPRVMAAEGDFIYYVEQGGWAKKVIMIEVNAKTKRSRRLLGRNLAKDEKADIQGLAVVGNRAFIADRTKNEITVIDIDPNRQAKPAGFGWNIAWKLLDHERMHVLRTLKVAEPGRIRRFGDEHLALVSDTSVALLDLETYALKPLITGLDSPLGLAVDGALNVYVGEMAPSHQVKVFRSTKTAAGVWQATQTRTIGKPGPHCVGEFDKDNLESPAGIEVDAKDRVWVCERNHELKRTSVWDSEGRCIDQVLGPTVYGGGGDIDPRDENRFFYRGKAFRRDPETGQIALTHIIWRGDNKDYDLFFTGAPHNFGGAAPAYPLYHRDRLYFTSWQGWAAGANTTLWVYDTDRVRPVAAIGTAPEWLRKRLGDEKPIFAWTDRNDDGRVQPDEAQTGPLMYDGRPWDRCGAQWQFRMNHKFEAAVTDGKYHAAGIAFFRVKEISDKGYPVYELPTELRVLPFPGMKHAADAVFTDRHGNAIALDEFVVSLRPDGYVNWRYKSRWPGLHSGHHTSARGDEPGVLIAPTRFMGSGYVNETIGEVLCISSNLGATYLFSEDGFFIDRVFRDTRVGLSWRMDRPPSEAVMAQLSLGDEHFGGTFQRVQGRGGRPHFRYVVGQPHCSVVELKGLSQVHRLPGGAIEVTAQHLIEAERLQQRRAQAVAQPKTFTIRRLSKVSIDAEADDWPKERVDGFALGYDDVNLYVWFSGADRRSPFKNASGDDFLEAFKHGDVVDVMLATQPGLDPKRTDAARGDIRLSFTQVHGKPTAILYDFVVPGTKAGERLSFSSPWRTVYVDRVAFPPQAKIAVTRRPNSFSLEASVPLRALHLDPDRTPTIRGDVGRVLSDQTGTRAAARSYWSNKNTNIVSDVPSEARLQPNLWGELRFEGASKE